MKRYRHLRDSVLLDRRSRRRDGARGERLSAGDGRSLLAIYSGFLTASDRSFMAACHRARCPYRSIFLAILNRQFATPLAKVSISFAECSHTASFSRFFAYLRNG
jgi:hypothetical protein